VYIPGRVSPSWRCGEMYMRVQADRGLNAGSTACRPCGLEMRRLQGAKVGFRDEFTRMYMRRKGGPSGCGGPGVHACKR
jgi:hypothetical protein